MSTTFPFNVLATDGAARRASMTLAHGEVQTPAFMTVGTAGAVKGITVQQLLDTGADIMLMNALHLAWRPGEELVEELGGLHRFTGWPRPILTDSGGFQIFSLPGLRTITEEGATFASPVDGAVRLFSPETVMELENRLAPDIIMALDHCPAHGCAREDLEAAVERSIRWLDRCVKKHAEIGKADVHLFGIVQGGTDSDLRRKSMDGTFTQPLPGFALGGFSVGESTEAMHAGISFSAPLMPADKPRYLMGMGTPLDILHAVSQGIDLFDCTLPTRTGRNAQAYTAQGLMKLRNARFVRDERPIDETCDCYTCTHFSRALLRHLFLAREMNAAILTSLHNVAFYQRLMGQCRAAIEQGRLEALRRDFTALYESNAHRTSSD